MPFVGAPTGPPPPHVPSPELALVDADLRAVACAWLDPPQDTLARIEDDLRRRRIARLQISATDEPPPRPRIVERLRLSGTPAMHRRLVAGGAVAASLAVALLVGVEVDVRGEPAGARSTAAPEPARTSSAATDAFSLPPKAAARAAATATKQKARKPAARERQTAARSTPARPATARTTPHPSTVRVFAWAPVPDATGYHVELFDGDRLIYARRATEARLELPRRWIQDGVQHVLGEGTYRWYVWPEIDGLRQSQAVVQARLDVA